MFEQVAPVPPEWSARFVPQDKFIVCHAGTIGTSNALDTLLDCARAMQDHPDVHFLIVGEGGLKRHYEQLCADLPNVTFTGPVPKDMVQSVLELCALLYFSVSPSKLWDYGLSLNKVIDYMLAGKPITASYTGYPTMVEEAEGGTSVPAGDPAALRAEILRLKALPPEVLQEIGKRGHRWLLANRSYEMLARDYLAIALRGAD
jgi:glycosyltransferase involved in cell wall biosynthesis